MKKIILSVTIAILATALYSCKKSADTTATTKTTDINKITGSWTGQDTSRVAFGDAAENIACEFKKISNTEVDIIGWDNSPLPGDPIDTLICSVDGDLTMTVTSNNNSSFFLGMIFKQVTATHYTFTQAIHTGDIDGYLDKH